MYAKYGGSLYDPSVTQIEHALQSAYLAEQEGKDADLIVAALLHDVGHVLMDEHAGNADFLKEDKVHEAIGARWLKSRGFPDEVVQAVQYHVNAKRYLTAVDAAYYNGLSEMSKRSLELQGGPFAPEDAETFIGQEHAKRAVSLRLYDDKAKTANLVTPPLEHFRPAILETLSRAAPGGTFDSCKVEDCELTEDMIATYQRQGWLHMPGFFTVAESEMIRQWADELETWPESGEEWMQHYEWVEPPGSPEKVRVLARSENFMHLHRGWRAVASRVHAVLAQCEGHDMALFKEKLNYKSPGGAGFRPHQDAAAYGKFASSHCTCMVAIDNADSANGCLQMASAVHQQGLSFSTSQIRSGLCCKGMDVLPCGRAEHAARMEMQYGMIGYREICSNWSATEFLWFQTFRIRDSCCSRAE
ncbi:hypothetical protein CYMTET_12328 [Cymbomonas tetramitiformis]|uniref:HD/PDEase domain-containing protein n=1 Tax=Cymbomonas tetramitiformis TaxID=36881 RepID=A0AAE0GKQ2_9CHLO|nr:hypothetical protein CYMTET_12328 [Cymbomonas tetramitiformis]